MFNSIQPTCPVHPSDFEPLDRGFSQFVPVQSAIFFSIGVTAAVALPKIFNSMRQCIVGQPPYVPYEDSISSSVRSPYVPYEDSAVNKS